jgi:hypothetical protein
MIKLGDNWNESWRMYDSGDIPQDIWDDLDRAVMGYADTQGECEENATKQYADYMGGCFYLCETPEDLKQISTSKSVIVDGVERWANLTEASDIFDVCDWLPGSEHVVVAMFWNNAGGDIFYIPKRLVGDNVAWSIGATQEAWSNANPMREQDEEQRDDL